MRKKKYFAIAIMVSLLFIVVIFWVSNQNNALSTVAEEVDLNGGFEETDSGYPADWAFFPDSESDEVFQISLDTTESQEGEQSLKLTTNQNEKTVGFRSLRFPVETGNSYQISFAVINDGCRLQVRRIVQDRTGTDNMRSEIIVDTFESNSEWRIFSESLTAAEGEKYIVLIFLVDGPCSILVDNVQIEQLPE